MKVCKQWICMAIALALCLLMPFSAMAAEGEDEDKEAKYVELFSQKPPSESDMALYFKLDPQLFVSVLAKQKYGTVMDVAMVCGQKPWGTSPDRSEQKRALMELAEQTDLSQAERRVIKRMLTGSQIQTDYDMWSEGVDYRELFSHLGKLDGAYSITYAQELKEVFLQEPHKFLQEMADSDVNKEQLSQLLMGSVYYTPEYREETEKLLQSLVDGGELNDAQQQMLQQLWQTVEQLTSMYDQQNNTQQADPPAPQPDIQPEITPEPEKDTEPKQPPEDKAPQTPQWVVPVCLAIAGVFIALGVILVFTKKK